MAESRNPENRGYTNDVPKWKGYIREALTTWETDFQTTQLEYLDDACFLLTCVLLPIPLFADSIHETAVTRHLKWMTPLAILAAVTLAFFAACLFARTMWKHEQLDTAAEEEKDRSAAAKKIWNRLRWLPCMPTLVVSIYSLSLFSKTQGKALYVAMAAFVFNLLWLTVRCYRTWKVCKWVKKGQS